VDFKKCVKHTNGEEGADEMVFKWKNRFLLYLLNQHLKNLFYVIKSAGEISNQIILCFCSAITTALHLHVCWEFLNPLLIMQFSHEPIQNTDIIIKG
jgi:hypothetical protein